LAGVGASIYSSGGTSLPIVPATTLSNAKDLPKTIS
jgi:hypothetical protein